MRGKNAWKYICINRLWLWLAGWSKCFCLQDSLTWNEFKWQNIQKEAHWFTELFGSQRGHGSRDHSIQVLKPSLEISYFPPFFLSTQKTRICFLLCSSPCNTSNILIICLMGPRRKEHLSVALAETLGENQPGPVAHACGGVSSVRTTWIEQDNCAITWVASSKGGMPADKNHISPTWWWDFICFLLDDFFLNNF